MLGLWVEIVWWFVGPVFVLAAVFVGLPDAFAVIFSQGVMLAIVGAILWLIWRRRVERRRTRWVQIGRIALAVSAVAFVGSGFTALTFTEAPQGLLAAALALAMIALALATSAMALHVRVVRFSAPRGRPRVPS